jgi:hypothetical protein
MIIEKIGNCVKFAKQLAEDRSGLALVEFAVGLPFFLGLTVGGIETANYAKTVMQLNQLTIHTADSGARMGEGVSPTGKEVSERQINDVFAGTAREGDSLLVKGEYAHTLANGNIELRGHAKIWMSSIEPIAGQNGRYRMAWQKCMGTSLLFTPTYGTPATNMNVAGIGPTNRQVIAPPGGAVMFVETKYWFKPLVIGRMSKLVEREIALYAAMVVRDSRDYTQIYNRENVAPSNC